MSDPASITLSPEELADWAAKQVKRLSNSIAQGWSPRLFPEDLPFLRALAQPARAQAGVAELVALKLAGALTEMVNRWEPDDDAGQDRRMYDDACEALREAKAAGISPANYSDACMKADALAALGEEDGA